jgi:hypothetical protein
MRSDDAQTRVSYVLALMSGTPRNVAFEVALSRWRAHNAAVDEAAARRAVVRILTKTVWTMREGLPAASDAPLMPREGINRLP